MLTWKVLMDGQVCAEKWVKNVPMYGAVCSGKCTGGNWVTAADWLLASLVLVPYQYNREGSRSMSLDTSTIPAEILVLAGQYRDAFLSEDFASVNHLVQTAVQVLKNLFQSP